MLPESTESTKEQNIASLLETIQGHSNENKTNSIKAFIEGDRSVGINIKDVNEIINGAQFINVFHKLHVFHFFFESEKSSGINGDDIAQIIYDTGDTGLEDDILKINIFNYFIRSERSLGITSKNVAKIIKDGGIKDKLKTKIFTDFIKNERSVGTTSKDVSQMIEDAEMIDDSQKVEIFKAFSRSERSLGINDDDVTQMISDAKITGDKAKSSIIKAFAIDNLCKGIKEDSDEIKLEKIKGFFDERGESLGINMKDARNMINVYGFKNDVIKTFITFSIDNLIEDIKEDSDEAKSNKINAFIVNFDNIRELKSDSVVKIIEDSKITEHDIKYSIINTFIERSGERPQDSITSEGIINIINCANFSNNESKVSLIRAFFESHKSFYITNEDVIQIIEDTGIIGDNEKLSIIKAFINREVDSEKSEEVMFLQISGDKIIKMINDAEFSDNGNKLKVITTFFKSNKSYKIESNHVIQIINETGIEGDDAKTLIIQDFVKKDRDETCDVDLIKITSQNVVEMINGTGIEDDNAKSSIIQVFIRENLSNSQAEHFTEITSEDVVEMINAAGIKDDNAKYSIIKTFIDANDLMNNDREDFLYLVDILENEKNKLSLVKDNARKQYPFLTETFGDKALQDCITQDGISDLKGIFGNDLTLNEGNPITISALISYYDLKNEIPSLSQILSPEFKAELQNNFSPSADRLLYKSRELEKLNQLLNQEGVEFNANSYFIENTKLCEYLLEKAGVVEEVNSSKEYKINFENFSRKKPNSGDVEMTEEGKLREEALEKESQERINTSFNKILQSPNINIYPPNPTPDERRKISLFAKEVGDCFSELFKADLLEDGGLKFTAFFQENRKEIAHCFCNENLKKEDFEVLFKTLKDGCFSNIGAQFKKALYATMIKDEGAQILYSVADKEIFSAIINNLYNDGEDIMVGNFNPIDNTRIKSYFLSPMALIEKITREEVLGGESWKIIGKNIEMDKVIALSTKLEEANKGDMLKSSQESKKIASYFIIKKVVGEEKMTELENKNPKLKELGDFIYKSPQTSPKATSSSSFEDSILGKRKQSDGGPGLN